jgi:hypothetical protein
LSSQSPVDAASLLAAGQKLSLEEVIEYALENEGETL